MHGLAGIPLAQAPQTRKDYTSDQEVRWCPGCGDYVILSTFQAMMADLGIARENTVVVSGIGCSSRFPYYVDCYGMHSIHGRATAIATGVAAAREDLNVWVITGDGDALSIGGNHLIHALRRNVNINILLFNNRIYGLTKGQYSPTSEQGKLTKSTPYGSLDVPFNPVALALGAEASFVARAVDSDRAQLTEVMNAAARHRGAALIEIYQNCPIFNDEAFDALKGPESANALIRLRDGEPVVFGTEEQFCVVREPDGGLRVTENRHRRPGEDRRPRRGTTGPVAGLRPGAAHRPRRDAPRPGRDLPAGGASRLRRPAARAGGRGPRGKSARRPAGRHVGKDLLGNCLKPR